MYSPGLPNLPHSYKSDRQRLFVEEDRTYATVRDEKSHCLLLCLREKGGYHYLPILVSTSQYILVEDSIEYADEIMQKLVYPPARTSKFIEAIVIDDPAYRSSAASPTEESNSSLQERFAKTVTYHAVYRINPTNLILILYSHLSLDVQFYHIVLRKKLIVKDYARILPNAISVSAVVETLKVDNRIFIGTYDRLYSLTFLKSKGHELHMFTEPPELDSILFGRLISNYKLSISFIPATATIQQVDRDSNDNVYNNYMPEDDKGLTKNCLQTYNHNDMYCDLLNCEVERLPTPSENYIPTNNAYDPVTLISTNNAATMNLADLDVVPDTIGAEEARVALHGGACDNIDDKGSLQRFPSKADTVVTPFCAQNTGQGTTMQPDNTTLNHLVPAISHSSYNDEANMHMRNQIQGMIDNPTACVVLIGGVVYTNSKKYYNKRIIYVPIDNMNSWVYQTLTEPEAIFQDWDVSFLEREKIIAFGGRRRHLTSDLRVIDLAKGTVYVSNPLHGCLITPRIKASIYLFYDKGIRKLRIESGCTQTEVLRDVVELVLPIL